jgi:hypothetical protein
METGVEIYPIPLPTYFLFLFVGLGIWVLVARRAIEKMGQIPLNDN